MKNCAPYFAGISLLLGTATQFRIGKLGVSEFFGFCFIVMYLVSASVKLSRSGFLGIGIWCVALLLGAVNNALYGYTDILFYDFAALFYVLLFNLCLYNCLRCNDINLILVIRFLSLAPLILLLLLFLSNFLPFDVCYPSGDDCVNTSARFIGWATNPNQLGILLCGMPFSLLFIIQKEANPVEKIFHCISIIACVYIAYVVKSKTIFVAWIVIALLLFAKLNFLRLFYMVLFPAALLYFYNAELIDISQLLNKGDNSDMNGRYPIWSSFFELFKISPFFGFGPGAHGGIYYPFQGWELHSLPLDILSQTGLIGFSIFLLLLMRSIIISLRIDSLFPFAVVCSAIIEMFLHNTERHPVFWFYLLFPLYLKTEMKVKRLGRY